MAHIDAIRALPGFEHATIVFIPESNLAFEAERHESALRRAGVERVVTVDSDENRAGFRTTNDTKKMLSILFNGALVDRRVSWYERFVSVASEQSAAEMRELIIKELRNYTRILKPVADPYAPPKEAYSGKIGGGCDDHCIAVQINVGGKNLFFRDKEKYAQWY